MDNTSPVLRRRQAQRFASTRQARAHLGIYAALTVLFITFMVTIVEPALDPLVAYLVYFLTTFCVLQTALLSLGVFVRNVTAVRVAALSQGVVWALTTGLSVIFLVGAIVMGATLFGADILSLTASGGRDELEEASRLTLIAVGALNLLVNAVLLVAASKLSSEAARTTAVTVLTRRGEPKRVEARAATEWDLQSLFALDLTTSTWDPGTNTVTSQNPCDARPLIDVCKARVYVWAGEVRAVASATDTGVQIIMDSAYTDESLLHTLASDVEHGGASS